MNWLNRTGLYMAAFAFGLSLCLWVFTGNVFQMGLAFVNIYLAEYWWRQMREQREREFHEWWSKMHEEPDFDIV